MYIFDLESDGFLDVVSTVHCLVLHDTKTGEYSIYNEQPLDPQRAGSIEEGVRILEEADEICGHNIIKYDNPVLEKLYGFKPKGKVRDTLVESRLFFADMKDRDFRAHKKYRGKWIPGQFFGAHSLEAWGHRLGDFKGDFKGPWNSWTPEMQNYGIQDVIVTTKLVEKLDKVSWRDSEATELEHQVATIIARQERNGVHFNEREAAKLYAALVTRKGEIQTELQKVFPPFYLRVGKAFNPKQDNKRFHYVKGAPSCKIKLVDFSPSSRDHIAIALQRTYGWKPRAFGKDGKPTVDDEVLSVLKYPAVKLLLEYLMLDKRTGSLAEGKQAWLKCVHDGKIHGGVNPNGAVTGRMTHMHPNLGQVPASYSPYGKECRALFGPRPGWKQVGCDADGLELRALSGYMSKMDGGAYAKAVVEGTKEEGTDAHSRNRDALAFTSDKSRDIAKTWLYAFLYGAGDPKLGSIAAEDLGAGEKPKGLKGLKGLGAATRAKLQSNIPALGDLTSKVKKASARGFLRGLDGRHIYVRSQHAALNTLLQGAGAIIMKRALVILDTTLQERDHVPGTDYEFMLNVHDEFQIECRPEIAEEVGKTAAASIREAGEFYNFGCPLAGSYDIGDSWADTH